MIAVVIKQTSAHHQLRKTQRIAGNAKDFPHFCERDTFSAWFSGQGSASC
jgi:hypothetical protein